jgi:hypothetical protein
MRARPSPSPATDRTTTVQPSVAANGACWRRQAVTVAPSSPATATAAAAPGVGHADTPVHCGNGRSPITEKR